MDINLTSIEKKFIDLISILDSTDISISRNKKEVLIISKSCPCTEIQYLKICIEPAMITFFCEITHFHFELADYKRANSTDPESAMLKEASNIFKDFILGNIVISKKMDLNGQEISTGWRHINMPATENKAYLEFMKKFNRCSYSSTMLHNFYQFSSIYNDYTKNEIVSIALEKLTTVKKFKVIYTQPLYYELSFLIRHLEKCHMEKVFLLANGIKGGYKRQILSRLRTHFKKL